VGGCLVFFQTFIKKKPELHSICSLDLDPARVLKNLALLA
jgi:hypothetical protein